MNELFGLSMTYIAAGTVIATAIILLFVALIAVRNPVMFKMGLRNIPRRKAQTALIIVGLMLSTLIISAAFGTGDTLTNSITSEVYDMAGNADELISWDAEKQPAPVAQQTIPLAKVDELRQEFAGDPDIQAFVPFLDEQIPLQDTRTKLNEASPRLVAFRTDDAKALGGLRDTGGNTVTLAGNEIAVNQDLADAIDAKVGDTLLAFYEGKSTEFKVKAIVPSTLLGGAFNSNEKKGAAVDFSVLAGLTGKAENADGVFVSNYGGVKGGNAHASAARQKLEQALAGMPYQVETFKKDGVATAELIGNAFTTVFIVFGLFSIAAGVLLIFLIFVMLAAERKPEMGMARAVGAKRRQIVESFLSEGMGYDLGSAVVGLVAGMAVTLAMVQIIKSGAGDNLGVDLAVTFTVRSMVVAFSLGVIATFLVIFISSWRASRLNITSAIRDLPESKAPNPESETWMGYYRAALNGMVALALPVGFSLFLLGPTGMLLGLPLVLIGLVSPWFYLLRGSNVALPRELRLDQGPPRWPWILGLSLIGIGWVLVLPWYFIALGLVVLVRDRKPRGLATWMPAAGILVPPFGFVLVLLQHSRVRINWSAGVAFAFAVAGLALFYAGLDRNSSFFFFLGASLLFLWAAVTLRYFGVNERASFTVTSSLLLVLWYLPSSVYEKVVGPLNGDIEMFFLSGLVMVTAGVFIIVYNADIVLPAIARLGSRFGRILPAIKTGVAYPLTSRFRTGMTMIMIGLIMFSLVMMATLNANFSAVFLNSDTKGGFDDVLQVNNNNNIPSIKEAIADTGTDTSPIKATGELRVAYPSEAQVENKDRNVSGGKVNDYSRYTIFGADQGFLEATALPIKYRAAGYESDRAIWDAMAKDAKLAVIPASLLAGGHDPFGGDDTLLALDPARAKDNFEPFTLNLRDPGTGTVTTVTVIGVMKEAADTFLVLGAPASDGTGGMITGKRTLLDTFPGSQGQRFYLALKPGTDADAYAKKVEAGLVQASADSLQKLLDEQQAIQNAFLLVIQGFMGLGLIVGIAALAVVASRAVVERRQQIGMLRAIGYQRGMVALSFLFESGFISLSGIFLGLGLGVSLAWVIFTDGNAGTDTSGAGFIVPWVRLGVIAGIAFGASMLMTYLPARSASKVPIAEALRYE
ncbi:MAG: FtsX-like permease family protein [Chloroflexi bacterium]|nr:FtsX-like permease family protein [Chloroflexota bacterium]